MKSLYRRQHLNWALLSVGVSSALGLFARDSVIDRKVTPGDTLTISVVDEPSLTKLTQKVDSEGKITFPLLKELVVKDKSTAEIEKLIRDELDRDWIINPQVTVAVSDYVKKFVTVNGYVGKPGLVEMLVDKKMRLIEVVSAAGDVTRSGNRKKIQLSRKGVSKIYNLDDLMKITESEEQIYVEPDDIVNVPQSIL